MKTIIAVDPGASGGVAWHDGTKVWAVPMLETRRDLIDLFSGIQKANGIAPIVAYTEKISGFIPDGGASMMFQFGAACERIGAILETLGIRIIEVTPQRWQKHLSLGNSDRISAPRCPKGLKGAAKEQWKEQNAEAIKAAKAHNARAKTEWKNKLKSEAQRRFPGTPITLKTCDACLILDYAMQQEGGGQVINAGTPRTTAPDETPALL